MPQIMNVIKTESEQWGTSFYLVLDEMPDFVYERRDNNLIASDDGFYACLCYERPTKYSKAFAGREFDIPMKDGTTVKATGQWWDGGHQANAPEPIASVGISTIDLLRRCYVFSSGHVSTEKLNAWLLENTPFDDYHGYKKELPQ